MVLHDDTVKVAYRRHLRPDFQILYDDEHYKIIVEVDERQHNNHNYSLETERSREVTLQKKFNIPCIFIRYNPDSFKLNGKTVRTYAKERHKVLISRIKYYMDNPPTEYLQKEFLFYSEWETCKDNGCSKICSCERPFINEDAISEL